jgi:hypothetical protein
MAGQPALPLETTALRTVARVALEAMSRRQLTEAIQLCERIASRDASWRAEWMPVADAFRAERRRRYS